MKSYINKKLDNDSAKPESLQRPPMTIPPFPILFNQIGGETPAPDQQYCYRRYATVMMLQDKNTFPNYPVMMECHDNNYHLVHESPRQKDAQDSQYPEHREAFFNDVLFNPKLNVKKVVVFDSDGCFNYFKPQASNEALLKIKNKFHVKIDQQASACDLVLMSSSPLNTVVIPLKGPSYILAPEGLYYITKPEIPVSEADIIEKNPQKTQKLWRAIAGRENPGDRTRETLSAKDKEIIQSITGHPELEQFKLTIEPTSSESPLTFPQIVDVYQISSFSSITLQQWLDIYDSEGDIAIHGSLPRQPWLDADEEDITIQNSSSILADASILEFAYCLFRQHNLFYPNGTPDFSAIQKKLEALRVKYPGMITNAEDYRTAIRLGEKLYLKKHKLPLSDQLVDEKIEQAARKEVTLILEKKLAKDFIKIDEILTKTRILKKVKKYRDDRENEICFSQQAKKRRIEQLNAAVKLIRKLHSLKEKAETYRIDLNTYVATILEAVNQAISTLQRVPHPQQVGFFSRFSKRKAQKPGSDLIVELIDFRSKIQQRFPGILPAVPEKKSHLPVIDLQQNALCPLQVQLNRVVSCKRKP